MTEGVGGVRNRQFGLLTSSCDPILIDSVAQAGMDFLWLDAEFTGLSAAQVGHVVHRVKGRGVSTLVRVPAIDQDTLVTFANMGVDEIVLPRVRTLDQVERACAAVTYPPEGERPRQVTPATAWGARYDSQPVVSIIVETLDAVRALPRLLENGRLFSFWLGHNDLSDDYAREYGNTEGFEDYVAEVFETLRQAGASFGHGVPDPSEAELVWASGATRCALYWDVHLHRHLARSVSTSGTGGTR